MRYWSLASLKLPGQSSKCEHGRQSGDSWQRSELISVIRLLLPTIVHTHPMNHCLVTRRIPWGWRGFTESSRPFFPSHKVALQLGSLCTNRRWKVKPDSWFPAVQPQLYLLRGSLSRLATREDGTRRVCAPSCRVGVCTTCVKQTLWLSACAQSVCRRMAAREAAVS